MSKKEEQNIDVSDIPVIAMRTATLDVTLKDVWGGKEEVRFQEITKKELKEQRTKKIKKSSMPDLDISRQTDEVVTIKKVVPVNSFEIDSEGRPILPLGRKIRGTIKAIGFNLADISHPLFPHLTTVKRMIQMVNVEPEYVILSENKDWKNNGNYYFASSPQPLKGRSSGSHISLRFDAIKEVKTTIVIKYPEVYEKHVKSIIQLLPTVKTLNRRMTKVIVDKVEYT